MEKYTLTNYSVSNRALQFGHSINFFLPLIGIVGMIKNSVRKFIPVFSVKDETILHCEQRIGVVVCELPQVKYFVPMIKNIILLNCRFQVF